MNISIISFTRKGIELSEKIKQSLKEHLMEVLHINLYTKYKGIDHYLHRKEKLCVQEVIPVEEGLKEWTKEQFEQKNAIIYVGACGIAVRAIAPYIQDKLTDSPVLVMDEAGSFVIPILSGHYGGANALARILEAGIQARAVITTATDVNNLFAVDVFAKSNHLSIINKEGIVKVSGKLLDGDKVTLSVESSVAYIPINIPEELTLIQYPPANKVSILISPYRKDLASSLLLLAPKAIAIGIGCRKGKSYHEIEAFTKELLEEEGILWESVFAIVSIDRKKEEAGIKHFAQIHKLPFVTYLASELHQVSGSFEASEFVQRQVGVDNVCERSAMLSCGEGARLIRKKTARNGITIAIAEKRWKVGFDEA